ncbi:CHAT domain-containing protein [Nodularia sp. UHCC 0506]|uniref:CHAT domain-containing protein n=1 Tax=Nodularia sp. UHCC 0506 TaxID=3110243 RepID=UPI002B21E0ED|nr:CHAT domain-containing protein [Nodularia sp. UHCC 0506]MEA5515366.1 CHAT domain-containing protein [Nodularia sp. UHCC 0506]
MIMQPAISLIITVYNRERYLSAAIDSIIAQTRNDFELLIWDDGSTDSSPDIAREYAQRDRRIKVIVAEHLGRGLALKTAIAQTNAPYLGWVDSDDLLHPEALAKTAAVLDIKPDIGWVYTDYLDIDEHKTVLSYGYRCLVPYNREELLNKFMTFHFRLMRREVFELAGGIDESLEFVEDYDLCLRLSEVAQVQHIYQPLYYYRTHAESISWQQRQEQIRRSRLAVSQAQQRRKSRQKIWRLANKSGSLVTQLTKRLIPQVKIFAVSNLSLLIGLFTNFAPAQSITPASDGTGTVTNTQGNNIDISGGTLSSDQTNLFHSFSKFGLDANQTANFLSNPNIQNILGRVTGGDASLINGLITVTGGNSNLFLINPAGIIFGANASLNVPASFTATTANRIGFGENWFNSSGANNYTQLLGTPNSFAFDSSVAGAIVNEGNLTVPSGNLALLGGTVASTGELAAPGGNITVAAVPGTSLLRLSIDGNPLSLEVQPLNSNDPSENSLAKLLTGGGGDNASRLQVNSNGEVELTGSGLGVENGDVVVKKATAETATLTANRNLTLPESQLLTTGNLNLLAENIVKVRESSANAFTAIAGGNLYVQGNQGIDVLAIDHLDKTPFVSGGDLTFVSDGQISLDAHFASGGKFSILNTQGQSNKFISLYDPIISANEDVIFASYTGPSLKVESTGSITVNGDITITQEDFILSSFCSDGGCSPDAELLGDEAALILRAGVSELIETNFNADELTNLNPDGNLSSPGNITVTGNISTNPYGGPVIMSATGDITLASIETLSSFFSTSGRVELVSGGNITTDVISTASTQSGTATAGNVTLDAGGNITTDTISAFANSGEGEATSGLVDIKAGGTIEITAIDSFAQSSFGDATAGNVILQAGGSIQTGTISAFGRSSFEASATGGLVEINAGGNIQINAIDSFAQSSSGNATGRNITLNTGANITTGLINSFATVDLAGNATGGVINLTAGGTITTSNIDSFAANGFDNENGDDIVGDATSGNITLESEGNINTGAINSSTSVSGTARSGGINLQVNSTGTIVTGAMNSSALSINSFDSAFGGPVTLQTSQIGSDITFESINTQAVDILGGTAEGGNVNILANGVVRGLGLIGETNNTILTNGATQPGSVTIQHDGGANNEPFIVGNASLNGIRGSINNGIDQITPDSLLNTFPVLPTNGTADGTPSNISINSINTPPTLTANTVLPTTGENQSITFRFGDFNVSTNDVNADNVTVSLEGLSGTLTLEDGTPVTSETPLSAETVLIYTPPANTSGESIPALRIITSDRVSDSSQQISVNVTPTPPPEVPETETETETETDADELKKDSNILLPVDGKSALNDVLETAVATTEQEFTNQFQEYLGKEDQIQITTVNQTRDILQNIEKAVGIKPAIIYVSFVPNTLPGSNIPQNVDSPDDLLELIMVTARGKVIRKVVDVKRSQVIPVVQQFRSRVTDPILRRDYLDKAQQLHQWLIQPIQAELKEREINNLAFIMDKGLRSLPVAALHDGEKYLVENYSVGLVPSLSLTDTEYVDIKDAEVLGMGASQFTDQQPLPAVPVELDTITLRLWSGESFLNEDFTLQNLQAQRQQKPFGIIHLATHGEFRPGSPSNSYIQLWDTRLQMDQLRQLGWNNPPVQLVVLSACRTAVGDTEAELGFASFAVQAGVKSALASLWYVSDEGTLGLISEFYEQLKQAPIKSEALRQAQVGMLKGQIRLEDGKLKFSSFNADLPPEIAELGDKNLSHPYFWSAFTMIGNPW